MAPKEELDASSETRISSHPLSNAPSDPPARSDQQQRTVGSSAFSHPGARIIAQRAEDGDGPYRCRKCGDAVLTISVKQCPGCLDNYPWFPSPDDEEPA